MRLITRKNADGAIVSLGAEEAMILLQPGKMVRNVLDHGPARFAARFLTPLDDSGGVLALLSRDTAAALLQAQATHAVEQDLQMLLFDFPTATPHLQPPPSHGSHPPPDPLLP